MRPARQKKMKADLNGRIRGKRKFRRGKKRGVWRKTKGGTYYVGLNGEIYRGKEASTHFDQDKIAREKNRLAHLQMNTPSLQGAGVAMALHMNDDDPMAMERDLNWWGIPKSVVDAYGQRAGISASVCRAHDIAFWAPAEQKAASGPRG